MGDAPTLSWDLSDYLSYGECGVVIDVSLDVFPGEEYMVTNYIDETYGTAQSPLADSGSVVLDELPPYISYCEMDVYFHVYFRYSGSPWNLTATVHAEYWLYTVLDAPVDPQVLPWWGVLKLATKWKRFATNEEDALTYLLFASWGVECDYEVLFINDERAVWKYRPENGQTYTEIVFDTDYAFNLHQWIEDFIGQLSGECSDVAVHLVVFSAAVGIDADPLYTPPEGYLWYSGPTRWSGRTDESKPAGRFNYHVVLDHEGVYDGCIGFPDENGMVIWRVEPEGRMDLVLDWDYASWFALLWDASEAHPLPDPIPTPLGPGVWIVWHEPE